MFNNDNKPARSWQEIAEEASHEKDPKRMAELVEELNRALELRERAKRESA